MARSLLRAALLGLLILGLAAPLRAEDVVDDDEYDDAPRAFLVVRKSVQDDLVVQGKNVTVTVEVFNAGQSTAKQVKLTDVLPAESTLVDGTLDASLGKIAMGSHAKHSYVIVFNTGSIEVTLPDATVTYQAEDESSDLTEGASSAMTIYVMTPAQQLQRFALQAGAYASLGFARSPAEWRNLAIIAGTIGSALGVNWAIKKAKASNVNRKRAAALRELEKSE